MAIGKISLLVILLAFGANVCRCKAAVGDPVKKAQVSFVESSKHPKTTEDTKVQAPTVVAMPTTAVNLGPFAVVFLAVVYTTVDVTPAEPVDSFDPPLKSIILRPRVRPNAP